MVCDMNRLFPVARLQTGMPHPDCVSFQSLQLAYPFFFFFSFGSFLQVAEIRVTATWLPEDLTQSQSSGRRAAAAGHNAATEPTTTRSTGPSPQQCTSISSEQ